MEEENRRILRFAQEQNTREEERQRLRREREEAMATVQQQVKRDRCVQRRKNMIIEIYCYFWFKPLFCHTSFPFLACRADNCKTTRSR